MTETLWRCDQHRAGILYSRFLFNNRPEAESFAQKMRQAQPDQFISVEAVPAATVWN